MIPDIQYWNIDLEYLSAADGTLETDLKCITEHILHKFQEAKEYKQKKNLTEVKSSWNSNKVNRKRQFLEYTETHN